MTRIKTEQELFWEGEFGNEYIQRNQRDSYIPSNIALFAQILSRTNNVNSLIEFGANIGLNLKAIKQLLPQVKLSAIEINSQAVEELKKMDDVTLYHQSILDYFPEKTADFALVKGVLIHINPEVLPQVYDLLYQSSNRYICIAEYYNPSPVEVNYRGHQGKLFKRDFAGEMLDKFADLNLVDYGFVYHRAYQFPQDDINWFLLKKNSR